MKLDLDVSVGGDGGRKCAKKEGKMESDFFESKGNEDWKERCIVSFKKEE